MKSVRGHLLPAEIWKFTWARTTLGSRRVEGVRTKNEELLWKNQLIYKTLREDQFFIRAISKKTNLIYNNKNDKKYQIIKKKAI